MEVCEPLIFSLLIEGGSNQLYRKRANNFGCPVRCIETGNSSSILVAIQAQSESLASSSSKRKLKLLYFVFLATLLLLY